MKRASRLHINKIQSLRIMACCFVVLMVNTAQADDINDEWRMQTQHPGDHWMKPDFDDSRWTKANGGFGTRETPGARVGTIWQSDQIWMRKTFTLDKLPKNPALLLHYDEDPEIYINGKLIAKYDGWLTEYKTILLDTEARKTLKVGENLLAVHCVNHNGGQFIDVHVIDADQMPELSPSLFDTLPFQTELITPWGEKVTPENVWTEYPRPQMRRKSWKNLNGHWDYAITADAVRTVPKEWTGQILVPFCLESKLGGVQRLLLSNEALWYRRIFEIAETGKQRTLLNFEAIDYRSEIYVNGKLLKTHQGGHTPFSVDITSVAKSGSNELIVRVEDETEGWQLRGKQVLHPQHIWYTRVSGIWQTVWLEQVPQTFIRDLKIHTSAAQGVITIKTLLDGDAQPGKYQVVVKDGNRIVAKASAPDETIKITIPNAKLWSPDSPHLYDLEVTLLAANGQVLDKVQSYTGLRDVGKIKDASGHWRFTLNGQPIFHWGTLDQGWWPDGLLTPPSDEALRYDVEFLKEAGFNMVRKHIKVEPRRFYYHCDQLGLLVWQDQVSGGPGAPWTLLRPNPRDATWPRKPHEQYMLEFERMVSTLENHPSIVVWVPFNEAWTQHSSILVGKWIEQRDPTRHVNIASGGNFWPVGDIVDAHNYPHPVFPFEHNVAGRFDDYIKVIGEFGGHGYPVAGHLWQAGSRNWGYGGLPQDEAEYRQRYLTSLEMLNELRGQGIAAGVYTQTTDVEGEINGLLTYDRKVIKIPAAELAELHKMFFVEPMQSE